MKRHSKEATRAEERLRKKRKPKRHNAAKAVATSKPPPATERTEVSRLTQKAKAWELRTATSMARIWRYQAKLNDAHELLASVYG
jgi:hypothetical protein